MAPLPWRRPWKVASQVATVDQLSGGRAVLSIGLGAVTTDLPLTGEVVDRPRRAAMMDDGIDLIRTLWAGGGSFHGQRPTPPMIAAPSGFEPENRALRQSSRWPARLSPCTI